jgi:hypothetical protein
MRTSLRKGAISLSCWAVGELYVSTGKGKRLYLTLPTGIYDALERWAESENNKAATLAAFIIEREVRDAQTEGKIPPPGSMTVPIESSLLFALASFLDRLAQGEIPPQQQLVSIADSLGLSVETLVQLSERVSRRDEGQK